MSAARMPRARGLAPALVFLSRVGRSMALALLLIHRILHRFHLEDAGPGH